MADAKEMPGSDFRVSDEVAVKLSAGAAVSDAAHSFGCWQEASVSCYMVLSIGPLMIWFPLVGVI